MSTTNTQANPKGQALWGDKQALMNRYEGLNRDTLNHWLTEMHNNKLFREGVINPTHRLVFVKYSTFEAYLYWKQHHNLPRGKKHEGVLK